MATRYRIKTRVSRVEEKIITLSTHKHGEETITEKASAGWFVNFEGSWESLFLGKEKPNLQPGQHVNIIIE